MTDTNGTGITIQDRKIQANQKFLEFQTLLERELGVKLYLDIEYQRLNNDIGLPASWSMSPKVKFAKIQDWQPLDET